MTPPAKRHFGDTDIRELIHQYKRHDCLWNIFSPDYKSKSTKKEAWLEIANYFQKEVDEVKRKVQYLRTAYVHEKKKVDASMKSGTNPHKPSLFYYKDLDFLNNMVIWRKTKSGSEITDSYFETVEFPQDVDEDKKFISIEEDSYLQEPEINCKTETYTKPQLNRLSPSQMPVSSTPKNLPSQSIVFRPGKRKITHETESNKLISTSNSSTDFTANHQYKDVYISFGKTIALQLQHLPLEVAILAMSEIHTILTKKHLEYIRSLQNGHESTSSNSDSEENYIELIEENFSDFS